MYVASSPKIVRLPLINSTHVSVQVASREEYRRGPNVKCYVITATVQKVKSPRDVIAALSRVLRLLSRYPHSAREKRDSCLPAIIKGINARKR